jgi:hypothetical protein
MLLITGINFKNDEGLTMVGAVFGSPTREPT